ncbi:MAG: LacI family transcriptional regulator [Actinomycetia bacterium]|nr:LacI family transcriptional regulator [Actinomycetes bacterium]
MAEPPARPTLATVARIAGVSVASVSRVLNGMPASSEMESRVRNAADSVGYVPDAFARSLRAGRTDQLALAVADVGNPVYVAMMRAIETHLRSTGYRLVLHSTGSGLDDELDVLASVRNGYVDGLILQSLRITDELIDELRQLTLPVVVIGTLPDNVPIDNVRTDSKAGMRLAVEHLVAAGRRRIALLNGPADTGPGAARAQGFAEGMAEAGLDDATTATCDDFTHTAGYQAAGRLLAGNRSLDALACSNDLIAMGALRALAEAGLRTPEDVAVIGMDDTDLAPMCNPPLSSVSLGAAERATTAVRLLLERIALPKLAPRRVTVHPQLVVRASTAGQEGDS